MSVTDTRTSPIYSKNSKDRTFEVSSISAIIGTSKLIDRCFLCKLPCPRIDIRCANNEVVQVEILNRASNSHLIFHIHSLFSLLFTTAKVESLHDIESTKPSRTYGQAKIYNYLIIKQVNQYIYGQNSKIVSKQSL